MLSRSHTPFARRQHVNVAGPFDFLGDIFDEIPGSDWIKSAAESGAGFIGDFAKTPVGFFTLQVISNNLYGPIANTSLGAVSGMQTVGPQIASVIWAMPGMAAGEPFTEAYIKEFIERVVGLIEYFGGKRAGEVVDRELSAPLKKLVAENPNFKDLITRAKDEAARLGLPARHALEQMGLTPDKLAERFHVRPDVAALGINAYFHDFVYDVGDPATSEFDFSGNHSRPLPVLGAVLDPFRPPLVPGVVIGPVGGDKLQKPDFFDVLIRPKSTPPMGASSKDGLRFTPSKGSNILRQLLIAAALTAPAWIPIFVLPGTRLDVSKISRSLSKRS